MAVRAAENLKDYNRQQHASAALNRNSDIILLEGDICKLSTEITGSTF